MGPQRLETRLGPVAWRSSGHGPTLVFFAGALANHDLWRDVITPLEDRYRCITIDLPLGAHPWPLADRADRSATSLARLLLECLQLLDAEDATVIANDTAGGLLLLSLASDHPALARIARLVLTNCESYDQFPPGKLQIASAMARRLPRLSRELLRLQLKSTVWRRRAISTVAASDLDERRTQSFFAPASRDRHLAGDLIAAMAGFRPQIMLDAAEVIPRFEHPVLVIWGDACEYFPVSQARRLASDFPHATLITIPGAKTWVPVDDPSAVTAAITDFVPLCAERRLTR